VSPVSPHSPRADLLDLAAAAESAFEAVLEELISGLPETAGVISETHVARSTDGREMKLCVSRPEGAEGPLPCIYHLHGGAVVIMGAASAPYERWRRGLCATGLVVVGVEFRDGAGRLGPYPYPAGLEDCVTGLK